MTHPVNIIHNPVVQSHGHYTGDTIGALQVMSAVIEFAQLNMDLMNIAATFATALANLITKIQSGLQDEQKKLWDQYHMDRIQQDIADDKVTDQDKSEMQEYTTALGVVQSTIQAGTKAIDPTLTTTQNLPNSLSTSQNEFLQEVGTLNQGQQALANDRIS